MPHGSSRGGGRSSASLSNLNAHATGVEHLGVFGRLLLESTRQGDGLVVSLYGRLGLDNATMLRDQVLTAQLGTITIVLSELDWIDESGLRLLLEAQHRALAGGRRLCLKIAPRQVDCLLEANHADIEATATG